MYVKYVNQCHLSTDLFITRKKKEEEIVLKHENNSINDIKSENRIEETSDLVNSDQKNILDSEFHRI